MRHLALFSSALLLSAGLLTGPAVAADEVLFDYPLHRKGDARASLEAVLKTIEGAPQDARVPLLLGELFQHAELAPGGDAVAGERLERLLKSMPPHWNRDTITSALAVFQLRRGQLEQAIALQQNRGYLDAWLVTGPLGLTSNASLHKVLPPEVSASQREVDPKQVFVGERKSKRRWHTLRRDPRSTSVRLGRVLKGAGAVTFGLTHIQVEAAARGYLVYRGPSAKLWLNRGLLSVVDRSQERLPRTLRIPISLRAGWNRLFVKMTGSNFVLRLVDENGAPLPIKGCTATPQQVAVGTAEVTPPYGPWFLDELALETTPQRRALYSQALANHGLVEEAYTTLRDLSRTAPEVRKLLWFQLLKGSMTQRARHLPSAVRRDRARQAFKQALALDPEAILPRRQLAAFEVQDDRTTQGVLMLEAAIEKQPKNLPLRLQLYDLMMDKSWLHQAEQVLRTITQLAPRQVPVLLAKARLADAHGKTEQAHHIREQAFRADRTRTWIVSQRVDRCLAKGDGKGALAALKAFQEASGLTDDELAQRRARVMRALGWRTSERKVLTAWQAAKPDDVPRKLTLANTLAEDALDDPKAAAQAAKLLDEVLAESPGAMAARRLRDALKQEEDRFWEEWTPDLKTILKESPKSTHWPRANTVCLFDQTVTRIYPDTSTVDVVHQVWRILNESGKERYGARPRTGETLQIRTITPDGQSLEPIVTGTRSYEMPAVGPGAVIEHAFKSESSAPRFQYTNGPFYFQDPDLSEPFWFSRWVLLIHKDAPVTILERNMRRKGITKSVTTRGDWKVFVFTAKNQPRIEREPFCPDRREILPWIKVVEKRTLDEIGDLYEERGLRARALTPSVARKADELVFGIDGDAKRASVLYDFVQEHVRRPSREQRPAAILASRQGDKTALFQALLRAADVPHQLALAGPNPNSGAPIDWDNPEPGQFSLGRRLIRIAPRGGTPFYVWPEAHRLAPYAKLPEEFWGSPVFICDPVGGALDVLPGGGITERGQRSKLSIQLLANGQADATFERVIPNMNAYAVKERLQSIQVIQLRSFFARRANAIFPGSRLASFDTPQLETRGAPLTWSYTFRAPRAVLPRGDNTLELRGLLQPSQLKSRFGTHRHRVYDLVLGASEASFDTVVVDLGPYACPLLPANVRLKHEQAMFSLRYAREGGNRIRIERRVVVRPGRVPPKGYKAFREFLRRMSEAEQAALTLEERVGSD